MKALFLFLLTLIGCPTSSRTYTEDEQAQVAVTIHTMCSTGSGVIISKTSVLTASHVISRCAGPYLVEDNTGKLYSVGLDLLSARSDLVRLSIMDDPGFPQEFATAMDKFPVIAYPDTFVCMETRYPKVERTCGKVTEREEYGWGLSYKVNVIEGNSGSALWDTQGHLVGIVGCYNTVTKASCGTILSPREWIISGS